MIDSARQMRVYPSKRKHCTGACQLKRQTISCHSAPFVRQSAHSDGCTIPVKRTVFAGLWTRMGGGGGDGRFPQGGPIPELYSTLI